MPGYYTQFSEVINRITPQERIWIESQLDADNWDPDSPPEWDAPIDDGFVGFEWEFEATSPNQQLDEGESYFWIYGEEAGDPDHVGSFVTAFLARFRPDQCFALTFAVTCSKPRLGEFSGGGLFATKDGYQIFDAYSWVSDRIERFSISHEPGEQPGAADGPKPLGGSDTSAPVGPSPDVTGAEDR